MLLFHEPQYTHSGIWTMIRKAGEVTPGVQSTVWHTTMDCIFPLPK